jgi:phytoene synthase
MSNISISSAPERIPAPESPASFPLRASSTPSFPTLPLSAEFGHVHAPFASEADRAACHVMIRGGSRAFFAASLLLPARLREDAYALYAFCRLSDDLVDLDGGATDAIARLRTRLDRAYAGRPADSPVDRAFADVVLRAGLPRALPEALIEGLAWDAAGFRCETFDDVLAYAARVASSVGAMMAVLMGVRNEALLARACDLGAAMQLTNIARDVGEDARMGRLYLPRAWFADAGLDADAWLAAPAFTPAIAAMVKRLLHEADILYRRAEAGIVGLPREARPGIFAARYLYDEIGHAVVARQYDSVNGRARVGTARKLVLLAEAGFAALTRRRQHELTAPALAQTRFLVEAARAAPSIDETEEAPRQSWSDRIVWVAELFAALEAREREAAGRSVT